MKRTYAALQGWLRPNAVALAAKRLNLSLPYETQGRDALAPARSAGRFVSCKQVLGSGHPTGAAQTLPSFGIR